MCANNLSANRRATFLSQGVLPETTSNPEQQSYVLPSVVQGNTASAPDAAEAFEPLAPLEAFPGGFAPEASAEPGLSTSGIFVAHPHAPTGSPVGPRSAAEPSNRITKPPWLAPSSAICNTSPGSKAAEEFRKNVSSESRAPSSPAFTSPVLPSTLCTEIRPGTAKPTKTSASRSSGGEYQSMSAKVVTFHCEAPGFRGSRTPSTLRVMLSYRSTSMTNRSTSFPAIMI
mmetsp:Transcript_3006/g.11613  ORF Transcript_3006/g.11613 Transcript_3006/m.11613 type:complete len:229 (+) Transcript_3006:1689-2375(+)